MWQRATPLIVASVLLCLTIGLAAWGLGRHLRDERAFAVTQHAMARIDMCGPASPIALPSLSAWPHS